MQVKKSGQNIKTYARRHRRANKTVKNYRQVSGGSWRLRRVISAFIAISPLRWFADAGGGGRKA